MKMNVTLKSNSNSSRRTRNRIREHGPIFVDVTRELTGHNSVAERVCLRGGNGWLGWLPSFICLNNKPGPPRPARRRSAGILISFARGQCWKVFTSKNFLEIYFQRPFERLFDPPGTQKIFQDIALWPKY